MRDNNSYARSCAIYERTKRSDVLRVDLVAIGRYTGGGQEYEPLGIVCGMQ